MSPISLDALASENPDLREPLKRLDLWLQEHSDPVIIPSKVARQLREVDPYTLAASLMLLVDAGVLRRVFKVTTPSGAMTDEEFSNVADIPERLPDRFNSYFDTADADVTPVFRRKAR